MKTEKILVVSKFYITEEEYQKLDEAMFTFSLKNNYFFVSAIYETGAIICNLFDSRIGENVKRDFPNLYKLINLAKDKDIFYIDLFDNFTLDPDIEKEYNLSLFNWNE